MLREPSSPGVHEDVGAEPVPLLDGRVCEAPDEHRGAFYQKSGP